MTLPEGSVLLHIGPYKTGTTAIQGALWESRDALAQLGVLYPGELPHEFNAALAVAVGRVDPGKDLQAFRERWHRLASQLRDQQPRIGVLSSEAYCEATDAGMQEVLDALGPATHVVVTVRPIVRLLGSQWQQYGQNIVVPPYDVWLRDVLDHPDGGGLTPSFWRRHRHDLLVERWVAAVGADRVTVVVVDDRDHRGLPAAFEDLLGVPSGTLRPPEAKANRSLTFPEAALIQDLVRRKDEALWSDADHGRFVRFGAARGLQAAAPDPDDERLLTPSWAVDLALEIGGSMARRIADSGATVVGSLDLLSDPALAPAKGHNRPVTSVHPAAAAALAAGIVNKMTEVHARSRPRPNGGPVEHAVWSRHRAVGDLLETSSQTADEAGAPDDRSVRGALGRVRRRLSRRG